MKQPTNKQRQILAYCRDWELKHIGCWVSVDLLTWPDWEKLCDAGLLEENKDSSLFWLMKLTDAGRAALASGL